MSSSALPLSLESAAMQPVFESVARYFGVLGEPTRLRILHAICQEEKCVNDIIKVTGMAQANVSRHLGLMYQAGMLSRRREGTQVFYRVAERLFVELCRSVTVQVLARMEEASRPVLHSEEVYPLGLPAQAPVSSANPKGKTSV